MYVLTNYYEMIPLSENEILLINTLTSALDIIDEKTKKLIEMMQDGVTEVILSENKELCEQLRQRGYIYKDRCEEQVEVERLFKLNKAMSRKGLVNSFTICPTMGCNLRCTYCFESEEQHKNLVLMTDGQLEQIFQFILKRQKESKELLEKYGKDTSDVCNTEINLFGGEPLLKVNYHLIERILEFCRDNRIKANIITNGTTIDYYLTLLKQYHDILSIQITVDGGREIHDKRRIRADGKGTYDVICNGIDKILKAGIEVHLRINVDRDNMDSLGDIKSTIEMNEWDKYSNFIPYASPVQCFTNIDSSVLKESEFLRGLVEKGYYGTEDSFLKGVVSSCIGYLNMFFSRKLKVKPWKISYCEATSGNNMCFAPNGTISTCLTYIGKGTYNIGTFDEQGVQIDAAYYDLWSNRNIFSLKNCKNCKYAFLCGGGCPVASLQMNNDIGNVVCSDIKNTLRVYVELMKDKIIG